MREKVRKGIYEDLYKRKYRYASESSDHDLEGVEGDEMDELLSRQVSPSRRAAAKPYFPPTPMYDDDLNPFGGALEPPVG